MSKQSEIREGIAHWIRDEADNGYLLRWEDYSHYMEMEAQWDYFLKVADLIIGTLVKQDCVLKVDRELPEVDCFKISECGYTHNCSHAVPHRDSGELCRQYSHNPCPCPKEKVAVEPLIEGKSLKEEL